MPDYMFLLESRLSPEQRQLLARVPEIAQAQEINVYLSGGAVRDLITGMPIRDMDFTVEGNPARMARELEKHGARLLEENERLRHIEMVFRGETDFSLAGARDEVYAHPGARPELRWATVIEDLRRRDVSINAIAISLNPASRGLLLDPTNGLADLEKREVRVLTMHSFTNQPARLLRVLRYAARLDFKLESRTADWFALAMERGLHESMDGAAVGAEVRQLAREEKCVAVLKAWEAKGLISAIHPRLAKRHPDYDGLAKLMRMRETMAGARVLPRLFAPVTHYLLRRLSPGERGGALRRLEFRAAEMDAVQHIEREALKVVKMLKGRKTSAPRDAYYYLESVPPDILAFVLTAFSQAKVLSKIRRYLAKWRPLRLALPAGELEALGVARGPKFDKILEDLFHLQLAGKGRNPQDRIRILRQLAGIKPEPKKKEKEKEKEKETKKKGKGAAAPAAPAAAAPPAAKGKGKKAAPASPAELEGEAEPAGLEVHHVEDKEGIPVSSGKIAAKPEKGKTKTPKKAAAAAARKPARKPTHAARKPRPSKRTKKTKPKKRR